VTPPFSPSTIEHASRWAHVGIAVGIALAGVLTWAAVWVYVDGPPLRHAVLHSVWRSRRCGRCIDEQEQRRADAEFERTRVVGRIGPVAREVWKP
jgi:hypothetical protein